jgi:ribosomal protein RSM22 (predicted rRNA methylase)
MQLPADLRAAIARALEGVSRKELARRAARMSELYRAGQATDAALHGELDALAYAVSRMPATYAAMRNALGRLEERCAAFTPSSVLDLGAGPGTASWAAADAWPEIQSVTQIDMHSELLRLGAKLSESAPNAALRNATRITSNLTRKAWPDDLTADLVMASYTLAELGRTQVEAFVRAAWKQCQGAIVIVEPGTPAGCERILRARDVLITDGARIAAPCPHQLPCPLAAPDWCHFSQRVARSRDQMLLKAAELGYEDEKLSYLVAVREELFKPAERDRILARPEASSARIVFKLCTRTGRNEQVAVGRQSADFKSARKREWGDEL